jgi:hypothetical protein
MMDSLGLVRGAQYRGLSRPESNQSMRCFQAFLAVVLSLA